MLLYGDVNFFFLVKIFAPCSSVSRSMLLESSSTSGVYFSSVGCGLHLRASFSLFSRHLIFFSGYFHTAIRISPVLQYHVSPCLGEGWCVPLQPSSTPREWPLRHAGYFSGGLTRRDPPCGMRCCHRVSATTPLPALASPLLAFGFLCLSS